MSSEAADIASELSSVIRALTLWPEWAGAIAYLDKRVENRAFRPPASILGTRIAIHAGAHTGGATGTMRRIDGLQAVARMAVRAGWRLHRDGTLRKAGAETVLLTSLDARCGAIFVTAKVVGFDVEQRTGWDVPGQVHWRLDEVVVVAPIICAGRQNVWVLDDEQRAQLRPK